MHCPAAADPCFGRMRQRLIWPLMLRPPMDSAGAGTIGAGAGGGTGAGRPAVPDRGAPAHAAAQQRHAQKEAAAQPGRPGEPTDAPRADAGAGLYTGRVSREQMERDIDQEMDERLMATLERGVAERLERMTMATLERGVAERLERMNIARVKREAERDMRRRLDHYWKVGAHQDFARYYAMRMARLSC